MQHYLVVSGETGLELARFQMEEVDGLKRLEVGDYRVEQSAGGWRHDAGANADGIELIKLVLKAVRNKKQTGPRVAHLDGSLEYMPRRTRWRKVKNEP